AAAANHGWAFRADKLQHSPYIPLPGRHPNRLAGIDKKQRHEIRRKLRKIGQSELPVRWYTVQDAATLDGEIDAFIKLMCNDPAKVAFLTPAMEEHIRLTAHCAFERDCLNLSFLEIDGQKASAYFSFDYLNRLWIYNSGIDWDNYSLYSPGWVLLANLLKWANENQREAFDFMRGNEDYKYRFGAIDRFVMRATLTPQGTPQP
ncbi:MAG: GNAT family N-acetyltransferase, partial [Anaerolineaceae bacterium]|nr:GNAT family N-acetyltransferase [Anaerolineaceae bacterium]